VIPTVSSSTFHALRDNDEMRHDFRIALREWSWDRLIVDNVLQGEYGALDVRGKVVVDVGAHIGAFSLLAAAQGARRVLAFEPGEENYRLLAINAASCVAIEPHHAAVWRSDRDVACVAWRPSLNACNTGAGSVVEGRTIAGAPFAEGERHDVAAVALDAIIERAGSVGLLKVDAEGSEYPILATSRSLDRVEAIVGEWHEIGGLDPSMEIHGLAAWTGDALMDVLEDRGFTVETKAHGAVGLFRATRR
jgi:FkbM family methyltransferase